MLTYYIPDIDETPDDARELKVYSWQKVPTQPDLFAEMAADYCHGNRCGWEWPWPVTFVVLEDGIEVNRYLVERETVPSFHASRIRIPDEKSRLSS